MIILVLKMVVGLLDGKVLMAMIIGQVTWKNNQKLLPY